MRDWLLKSALKLLWLALGQFGTELMRFVQEAEKQQLKGREAFDYVWRRAKVRYQDCGDWLLNLAIEALVGKRAEQLSKLKKKLRWPDLG